MKKYYEFAGVELEIFIPDQWMYQEERHLEPFRCESGTDPHSFSYHLTDRLLPPSGALKAAFPGLLVYEDGDVQIRYIGSVEQGWEKAYLRAEHRGKTHCIQIKAEKAAAGIGVQTVLNGLGAEHLVLEKNGVVLHASFVEYEGKGILFTAPSQTGKSTQAELWRTLRGARIINGDRAVVRSVNGQMLAAGLPYAGSSEYCEKRTLTLNAVVYLKQAPVTRIRRLGLMEGFRRIWEGCSVNTWDRQDVSRALDLVQELAEKVKVYELACTPDETAVQALEQAMKGGD